MSDASAMPEIDAPDAAAVREMWADCQRELRVNQREYALNRAFDRGDHWLTYDPVISDAVIREWRDNSDADARTTVNLFRARRRQQTARLGATELAFQVRASSADGAGLRKQRLNSEVLEYLRTRQRWEQLRARATKYALFGGNSAIMWDWDPNSRNSPPRVDEYGIAVPAGGVKLTALAVTEFGLEPGSISQWDATWAIRVTGAPAKQVQALYGMAVEPRPDATSRATPMSRMLTSRHKDARANVPLVNIYALYQRPTPFTEGYVAHYVNDAAVAVYPWPFPHDDHLNLYVFSCDDPDETWVTDPWLSDARGPQTMYNDVRTTIREHAQRAANARILYQEGSLDDATVFTDAPGEAIAFQGERPPSWMEPPDVARWLVGEVDRLRDEINDLLSSPDIARGIAPGDRNSGSALALLAEKADGPLGPFARDQARGWGVVATNVLRLLRHHMPEGEKRRITMYQNTTVPTTRQWGREDIPDDVEVIVPVEVTEPRSFAAIRAQMVDLARTFPALFEGIEPSTFAKMLGLSSVQQMLREMDGSQLVTWENELMFAGEIVMPEPHHFHDLHIKGHEMERNTPAYEMLPPERKSVVDDHIDGHKTFAAEAMAKSLAAQAAQQPQPPPEADTGDTASEGQEDSEDE